MAFGRDREQAQIKEAIMYVGSVPNPENIGDGVTGSPFDSFIGDDVGLVETGSIQAVVNDTFQELLTNTPQQLVRQDLTRRQYNMQFNMQQFNADTLQLAYQGLNDPAYTNGVWTGSLQYIGTDVKECGGNPYIALCILGELVDCRIFGILLYYGLVITASKPLAFANTYVTMAVDVTATPHPNFSQSQVDLQKNLGVIWIDNS